MEPGFTGRFRHAGTAPFFQPTGWHGVACVAMFPGVLHAHASEGMPPSRPLFPTAISEGAMLADPLRRDAVVTAAVMLGLLLAGCTGSSPPQVDGPGNVQLELIDEVGFAEVLQRHRGQVVLVDFWATWCPGCVALFPHTVELHERFADRGLAVISVDFDDPDEERTVALKFLIDQGATFENYISRYGGGTRSAEAFELDGSLPQMKLYDREGRLHRSFGGDLGEIDPQELDRAVEALLAET